MAAVNSKLTISDGTQADYSRFRSYEPHLVSCLDDLPQYKDKKADIFLINRFDKAIGLVSYFVFQNQYKQPPQNKYARIDLVIVDPEYRGTGLGRCLILGIINKFLKDYRGKLYSISCLAAHPAIAKLLEEVGFHGEKKEEKGFVLETLSLETVNLKEFEETIFGKLQRNLDWTSQKV